MYVKDWKASESIEVPDPRLNSVTLLLPEKALLPIVVTELAIVIEVSVLILSKARDPIESTELGIVNTVILGFCATNLKVGGPYIMYWAKASASIAVTLESIVNVPEQFKLPVICPDTTVYVPLVPQLNVAAWAGLIPTRFTTSMLRTSASTLNFFIVGD
jgi:hypothetical protein